MEFLNYAVEQPEFFSLQAIDAFWQSSEVSPRYHSTSARLIRAIQQATGLGISDIADLANIPYATFYRLAVGTTCKPTTTTFNKLLKTYCLVLCGRI